MNGLNLDSPEATLRERVEALAEDLLDFTSVGDLDRWLADRTLQLERMGIVSSTDRSKLDRSPEDRTVRERFITTAANRIIKAHHQKH